MGNMQQTGWSSQTWRASQVALVVKNPPAKAGGVRRRFSPWARRISWKRAWQCTSAFLPGESHGQGSLAGYSPWGHRESDMTEETQHRPYIEQRGYTQKPTYYVIHHMKFRNRQNHLWCWSQSSGYLRGKGWTCLGRAWRKHLGYENVLNLLWVVVT